MSKIDHKDVTINKNMIWIKYHLTFLQVLMEYF